jgi:iron-sulfur cluster repair protein YtfE (RIC family)
MKTQAAREYQALSLGNMEIRHVVENFPVTMRVFDEYGMDMCCGGAHTVKEAAWLHNIDPVALIERLAEVIDQDQH